MINKGFLFTLVFILQCTMANPKLEYSLNRKGALEEAIIQLSDTSWDLTGKPISPFELHKRLKGSAKKYKKEEGQVAPALYIEIKIEVKEKSTLKNSDFFFEDAEGKKYPALSKEQFKKRFPSPSYKMLRKKLDIEFKSSVEGEDLSTNCEQQCLLEPNRSYRIVYVYLLPLLPERKVFFYGPNGKTQELELRSKRVEPIEIEF